MGAQVGCLSLHEQYKQFFPRLNPGGVGVIQYLCYFAGLALDTVSLVEVVLFSLIAQVKVTGAVHGVYSSAIAPAGANVSVGVKKNGVLQGAYHVHNGTAQFMSRTFNVASGDLIEYVGLTANVGVVCRIIDINTAKTGMASPRAPAWFHYFVDGVG